MSRLSGCVRHEVSRTILSSFLFKFMNVRNTNALRYSSCIPLAGHSLLLWDVKLNVTSQPAGRYNHRPGERVKQEGSFAPAVTTDSEAAAGSNKRSEILKHAKLESIRESPTGPWEVTDLSAAHLQRPPHGCGAAPGQVAQASTQIATRHCHTAVSSESPQTPSPAARGARPAVPVRSPSQPAGPGPHRPPPAAAAAGSSAAAETALAAGS